MRHVTEGMWLVGSLTKFWICQRAPFESKKGTCLVLGDHLTMGKINTWLLLYIYIHIIYIHYICIYIYASNKTWLLWTNHGDILRYRSSGYERNGRFVAANKVAIKPNINWLVTSWKFPRFFAMAIFRGFLVFEDMVLLQKNNQFILVRSDV
jgi:hypothetical protein